MQNFDAYNVALELLRSLRGVVVQLKGFDADAADQLVRAGTSVVNNLAEGSGRSGLVPCWMGRPHGAGTSMMRTRANSSIAKSPCCGD